jgi:hypothetical protein
MLILASSFLIAAVNTFISFIYSKFSSDYLEYLNAINKESQRAAIRNIIKIRSYIYIYIYRIKW